MESTSPTNPSARTGPLFLFLAALLWSLAGIFTKSVAWSGLCLAGLRGLIAFATVGAILLARGKRVRITKTKLLAAFCYFAQGVLFMCANKQTTAANATVLQNLSPLFIILFNAVLLKTLPTKREWITCGCLFLGVILAFAGSMGGGRWAGNCMALVSALFYAGVFFLSKGEDADPLESLLLGNGCYLLFIPLLVTDPVVRVTAPGEWALILIAAFLSGIGAWLCFSVGIRSTSALQANFITMAEPVMAPLWTFLFLGERIGPLSFAGCAIVILTLLLYNTARSREDRTAEPPSGSEKE